MHSGEQHFRIGRIEHAEQVGGVIGIHLLEHVGRPFGAQLRQHLGLLQLRQLLQDVGQPVVVEFPEHLGAPLGRKPPDGLGHVDGFASSNCSSSCATPWPGIASVDGVKPWTFCQSTTCTGPRRPSRR